MHRELATHPAWQRNARARLLASTTFAAILLATFVAFARFPDDGTAPIGLEVFLVPEAEPVAPLPEPLQPIEIPEPVVREDPLSIPVPHPAEEPVEELQRAPTDWYAQMPDVAATVVASQNEVHSVNPMFDAKRREAAVKFAPSRAPVDRPIWDNVEIDQTGRRILVSGDCHRVLDEPSAARYELYETFFQYFAYCSPYKRPPKELPWVDEIRQQYAYLE